jgi:hypothetical protein
MHYIRFSKVPEMISGQFQQTSWPNDIVNSNYKSENDRLYFGHLATVADNTLLGGQYCYLDDVRLKYSNLNMEEVTTISPEHGRGHNILIWTWWRLQHSNVNMVKPHFSH